MKNPGGLLIALVLVHATGSVCRAQKSNHVLWYDQPAKDWNEALPLGNGRIGAMVFGRPGKELIQLNEQSLWTGGPVDPNPNPSALALNGKTLPSKPVLIEGNQYYSMELKTVKGSLYKLLAL